MILGQIDYDIFIENNGDILVSYEGLTASGKLQLDCNNLDPLVSTLENSDQNIDRETAKNIGKLLADGLFTGDIEVHHGQSKQISSNKGLNLRYRLKIESGEIARYPWELLVKDDVIIGTNIDTPIIRLIPNASPRKVARSKPLKILIIGSSPSVNGIPAVNIGEEIEIINNALRNLVLPPPDGKGLISITPEPIGTPPRILDRLKDNQFHIIHFIGHGTFSEGKGCIALKKEGGGLVEADSDIIINLFQNQKSLALIVLNACKGAAESTSSAYSSLGASLVKAGFPSVIAMRYSIRDDAAKKISKGFYEKLMTMPSDRNLQDVRNAIFVEGNPDPRDYASPVLFTSSSDGSIFSDDADDSMDPRWANSFLLQYYELINWAGNIEYLIGNIRSEFFSINQDAWGRIQGKFMANADQFTRMNDLVARFSEISKYHAINDDAKLRIKNLEDKIKKILDIYEAEEADVNNQTIMKKANKVFHEHDDLRKEMKSLYDEIVKKCIRI